MKLNYTSLQHPVEPVELPVRLMPPGGKGAPERRSRCPVLVLPLHGHLAPAAWAAAQAAPGLKVGYVQTAAARCRARSRRDVAELRERGLLCGHVTAAPAYGGEHEALSVAGALDAAAHGLGWDAVLVGPGPGIIGSDTRLGHGGMAALDTAHAALALGLPTLLSPRLSSADPRERHRGVSHHTLTVLETAARRRSRCRSRRASRDRRSRSSPPQRRAPPAARSSRRPAGLRGLGAPGPDDGPQHRGGPALLRGSLGSGAEP